MLRKFQDDDYKIVVIETSRRVNINGTNLNHERIYDVIVEKDGVQFILEAKSWFPKNAEAFTLRYLGVTKKGLIKGLDNNADELTDFKEQGAQLFSDMLSHLTKTGNHKWVFDQEQSAKIFKDTITNVLKDGANSTPVLKKKLRSLLNVTDKELKPILKKFADEITDFIKVIEN